MNYKERLSATLKVRNDIKKKRLLFDESKEYFGGDSLVHLKDVKNTSIKGHPMVYTNKAIGKKFGLKAMTIESGHTLLESPSYIEYTLLKSLSDSLLKDHTPHIVNYLGVSNVSNRCKALNHLNLRHLEAQGLIKNKSIVLVSEFLEGESLYDWSYSTENKNLTHWKGIVFQIVYTIHVLHKKFKMMHNDFHYGNVLMDTTELSDAYFTYKLGGNKYYIKNINNMPKVWDFEYAHAYDYPYKEIKNALVFKEDNKIPREFNDIYDLHFFITSLLELQIPSELREWIMSVYPIESISASDLEKSCTVSSYTSESYTSTDSDNVSSDNVSSDNVSSDNVSSDNVSSDNVSSDTSTSFSDSSIYSSDSSTSESDSESYTATSESSDESEEYLLNKRLRVGVEKILELPSPVDIINHSFFEDLKTIPENYTSECVFSI